MTHPFAIFAVLKRGLRFIPQIGVLVAIGFYGFYGILYSVGELLGATDRVNLSPVLLQHFAGVERRLIRVLSFNDTSNIVVAHRIRKRDVPYSIDLYNFVRHY